MNVSCDTLQADTTLLNRLRASGKYDYADELFQVQNNSNSLFEQLWHEVMKALRNVFNIDTDYIDGHGWLYVAVLILLVLLILVVLYIKRPDLFYKVVKVSKTDIKDAGTDNIYEYDFDKEIAEARRDRDWSLTLRLIYLQTLRRLADGGVIAWRPSKTPTQYSREVSRREFSEMTNLFLRVRYGGAYAGEEDCIQTERKQALLLGSLGMNGSSSDSNGKSFAGYDEQQNENKRKNADSRKGTAE